MGTYPLPHWPLGAALCLLLGGCLEPTQITVELTTDVACADLHSVSLTVGSLEDLDDQHEVTSTTECDDNGRIGSIVLVPSGDGNKAAIRVVAGINRSPAACVRDGYSGGCIVARRALGYIEGKSLVLPISLDVDCSGIPCGTTTTCVGGVCQDATISECPDITACLLDGETRDDGAPGNMSGSMLSDLPSRTGDAPEAQWLRMFGLRATEVTIDDSGLPVVVGATSGSEVFDGQTIEPFASTEDALLLALDADGGYRDHDVMGYAGDDIGRSVSLGPDGRLVVGMQLSHGEDSQDFITEEGGAATDIAVWGVHPGGADTTGSSFPQTATTTLRGSVATDGASYHVGWGHGALLLDGDVQLSGSPGGFIFKTEMGTGNVLWSQAIGSRLTGITESADGSLLVIGSYVGQLDIGGASLESGSGDGLLMRMSPQGEMLDVRGIGDEGADWGLSVIEAPDGSVYFGARSSALTTSGGDTPGLLLGKLTAAFEREWITGIFTQPIENHRSMALAVDSEGNLHCASSFRGTVDAGGGPLGAAGGAGEADSFVASFTPDGEHRYSLVIASEQRVWVQGLAIDSEDGLYVTGFTRGVLDVGTGPQDPEGSKGFVIKYR